MSTIIINYFGRNDYLSKVIFHLQLCFDRVCLYVWFFLLPFTVRTNKKITVENRNCRWIISHVGLIVYNSPVQLFLCPAGIEAFLRGRRLHYILSKSFVHRLHDFIIIDTKITKCREFYILSAFGTLRVLWRTL